MIDSLAVLAFTNLRPNPNADYLSDGITESLIYSLSQLPNVKVISRNAVFRYKDRTIDAQAAGEELDVKAVLVGTVLQREKQLSISVELVDTRDRSVIWGENYHRPFADILAVQSDITAEITDKEQALAWLEKAYATRSFLNTLKVNAEFDSLRREPRFQDILKQLRVD